MTTPSPHSEALAAALRRHRLAMPPHAQDATARARAIWAQPTASTWRVWPLLVAVAALIVADLGIMQMVNAATGRPLQLPSSSSSASTAPTLMPGMVVKPTHGERLTLAMIERHIQELNP